jgi:hypothetical protein
LLKGSIFSTALVLLLAGCAAPPHYEWVKEGTSKYERESVLSECSYQIKLNKTAGQDQPELMKLCMQGKGYRYRQIR